MRIDDIFKKQKRTFSFEFFPPKDLNSAVKFGINAGQLMKLDPSFVTVTYGAGGGSQDKTFDLVNLFHNDLGFTSMAHYTCVNATQEKIAYDMRILQDMGIENVMLLRGDPPKGQKTLEKNPDGFDYSSDLIKFVRENYDFCIGAAAYPEKHQEAPSMDKDIQNLKKKVDAGADFLVTQFFFDNQYYYDFIKKVREAGINTRIIPGIVPITNYKQIKKFADAIGATIPEHIQEKMEPYKDDLNKIYQMGVDLAIQQSRDLLENDAPGIHFYTLNRSRAAVEIYDTLAEDFKEIWEKYKDSLSPHVP